MPRTSPAAPPKTQPEERVIFWCFIIGAVILSFSLLPPVPWKYAKANATMGSRFPSDRKYTLWNAGNHFGEPVSWIKMKTTMCSKLTEFNMVGIDSVVVGIVGTAAGAGGAAMGCAQWTICKAHAAQRCSGYKTMAIVGIMCFILFVIGALSGIGSGLAVNFEYKQGKKKKEKETARLYTSYVAVTSFLVTLVGLVLWCYYFSSVFGGFNRTSYYPYPDHYAGFYMAVFAEAMFFVGTCAACYRVMPERKVETETQPEEYVAQQGGPEGAAQGAAALLIPEPGGENLTQNYGFEYGQQSGAFDPGDAQPPPWMADEEPPPWS